MTYAPDQLVDEVAYVAYYFHWPLETILAMEHPRRRSFIEAIASINRQVNGDGDGGSIAPSSGFATSGASAVAALASMPISFAS